MRKAMYTYEEGDGDKLVPGSRWCGFRIGYFWRKCWSPKPTVWVRLKNLNAHTLPSLSEADRDTIGQVKERNGLFTDLVWVQFPAYAAWCHEDDLEVVEGEESKESICLS